MKKIFTLVVALGTLSTVFAQPSHNDVRQNAHKKDVYVYAAPGSKTVVYAKDEHKNVEQFAAPMRQRDEQVARITRAYKEKIDAVKFNRSIKPNEKNRQIARLQLQRDREIKMANAKPAEMRRHDMKH